MTRARVSWEGGRRVLIAVVLACLAVVVLPAGAYAFEVKPFEITTFQLSTTKATEVVVGGSHVAEGQVICEPCKIVNLPYVPAFTQAGGHPWGLTAKLAFLGEELADGETVPTQDPKDVFSELPPGLLGDPQVVPHCALSLLLGGHFCPADTQLGSATVRFVGSNKNIKTEVGPIVNITPESGQSAEFGIEDGSHVNFVLTARLVHNEAGYTVAVGDNGVPVVGLLEAELTFWGVPADPSHDQMRGMFCGTITLITHCQGGGQVAGIAPAPFLSLPTDCSAGPSRAVVRADSWENPGTVEEDHYSSQYVSASSEMPAVTGCDGLQFDPSLDVQPDTLLADEPVGAGVAVSVPQSEGVLAPRTPDLRDAVVTLPEGMSINPGAVDGIKACEESGPQGINFTGPESEERGLNGELQLAPGHCPAASTVGTAEAFTPLLGSPVKGHVYLARPGCGIGRPRPCSEQDALDGNLYKLYLELGGADELSDAGIVIKEPGRVEANPATGQLTTRFEGPPPNYEGNPQAPFSKLEVHLNGGPRASLATPATCGPASATAVMTPWSAPGVTPEGAFTAGTPAAAITAPPFSVEGCAHPQPFNPGFLAGTVTPQAAKFSTFTLDLSRTDREQYVKGIHVNTPPGLIGDLASVPLCGETAADEGTCPASSQIGTTRVASGAGSHPFELEGAIYLTGPYEGSPFGLSIVVHVMAGPFDLGLKVVRARIAIDRETSAITVATDETGPYAIPQLVFGVPVRMKRVTVNIDRPSFMFNPTNCKEQQVTATVAGTGGTTTTLSTPFAVAGCRSLVFKPKFTASTSGHTNRRVGASLDVKLSYPAGSMGTATNIARTKVSLPRQLPSRLTTLQQACRVATFERDPAECPAASIVGIVRSTTPVLPVPLTGPAYFVSHGGEAFPSLIIVLEGDGIRVDLTGTTFINEKTRITSSTFKTVPDVPVSSFELYLPQGPNSALAANTNLCTAANTSILVKQKIVSRVHGHPVTRTITKRVNRPGLVMPTEFVAQNGAVFKQNTRITVTQCGTQAQTAKRKATVATHDARHENRTIR